MAYAITGRTSPSSAESGYEPPGSQTGIVSPTFKSWQSKKLAKQITYNPKKAKQILTKAGFKLNNGVFETKSGKPLSFTMINISGYTDWIQSASIVQDELKAIGIKVTPAEHFRQCLRRRDLQRPLPTRIRRQRGGRADPVLRDAARALLADLRPDRQGGVLELERYSNPEVRQADRPIRNDDEPSKQNSIVEQIEGLMVRDVPVIPVTEAVDWYEYNTRSITGWVTTGNAYAKPSAYADPRLGRRGLTHLKPKG